MTTWDNVKKRAFEMADSDEVKSTGSVAWNMTAEFAIALCEEIDRLEGLIEGKGKGRKGKVGE